METITNAVSAVSGTVTKAIYGEQKPATDSQTTTTSSNETGGSEPVSGLQGKGTTTEPYDQGNSETANTSNTNSLPIREKSALDNSASTADAVPAVVSESQKEAHVDPEASANPEAVADKKQVESELLQGGSKSLGSQTLGHGSVGAGDAGVSETKNLADTLSNTKDTSGVSSDFKSLEQPTGSSSIGATDDPKTPGLAGFGDQPSISPPDESQHPTTVSGIASGSSEKRVGDGDAGASATQNLSETLSKTDDPSYSGKHDAPFVSSQSANAQQAAHPGVAPVDVDTSSTAGQTSSSTTNPSSTTDTTGPPALESSEIPATKTESKDSSRLAESASAGKTTSGTSSGSPSGDKEKVSKMDKLKEKLHIGHKH